MFKVHILVTCSHCNGEAYQPIGEAEDSQAVWVCGVWKGQK
jgi:hypothetical protein